MATKEEIDQIKEQLELNAEVLGECPGPHNFKPTNRGPFLNNYKCDTCGGIVDPIGYYWYGAGLRHGMGNVLSGKCEPLPEKQS